MIDLEKYREQNPTLFKAIIDDNEYRLTKDEALENYVIDIGANIGMFSLYALSLGAHTVIAVEPNVDNYRKLCSNCNQLRNIITLNYAITSCSGQVVYVSDRAEHSRIVYREDSTALKISTLDLSSIVKLIPDDVNNVLLKIDCEGAEYEILLNSSAEEFDRISYIYAEFHSMGKHGDLLIDYLKYFGFDPVHIDNWYYYKQDENGKVIATITMDQQTIKFKKKE